MSEMVKGFGCRPIVTYLPFCGPASESPPGRNPRGLVGRSAVYGDLMGGGVRRRCAGRGRRRRIDDRSREFVVAAAGRPERNDDGAGHLRR